MPIYDYACAQCGGRFETKQSIHDAPLEECPTCGGKVRRVIHAAGIVFKGSGFYTTDYKNNSAKNGNANAGSETAETPASTSSEPSTPAKTETKVAEPTE